MFIQKSNAKTQRRKDAKKTYQKSNAKTQRRKDAKKTYIFVQTYYFFASSRLCAFALRDNSVHERRQARIRLS